MNLILVSKHVKKKMMEFTLPTLTIYWPGNIAKKQHTFQYKQCLCMLTLPKCKDFHNLQTRRKNIKRVAIGW